MKLIRKDEGDDRQGTTFTGQTFLRSMLSEQQQGGIKMTLVRFEDGSLTHWHDHPGEQVLYILSGKGRVGNEATEWEVEPGDVVYTAPGEKHWHGAAPGHSMTHISITTVGSPTWYGAPESGADG